MMDGIYFYIAFWLFIFAVIVYLGRNWFKIVEGRDD